MIHKAWVNLHVKDPGKSVAFFKQLGFSQDPRYGDCIVVGDVIVMLFAEPEFKNSTMHEIADTNKGTEVMISIQTENEEEVDEIVQKAELAGGTVFAAPMKQGWMYGAGFSDLDGHRWSVLHFDE